MTEPFTIRIFVPDGDPEGVRIVDRLNWTGKGLVIPRDRWNAVKSRSEFERAGVYILVGYGDDDQPIIYIGQADGVRGRIDTHAEQKEFWNFVLVFVSSNNDLNRGHITWLEWALIKQADAANRAVVQNGQRPNEPALGEGDKADTNAFLKQMLQIMPLVGVHAFEKARAILPAKTVQEVAALGGSQTDKDTIIVPANEEGFRRVFLGENCWHSIRISGGMLPRIKWIAGYQTLPVAAITHIAEVERIEPYGDTGKFRLVFKAPATSLAKPIPFADAKPGAMQGPRYTSRDKLLKARVLKDLVG
ncbi:GIY-YIG nuclease family protein [Phreatobacter aquaticus]|uniref:GIY-YIG nuclease family protein n=1 Tax=Phreatobacter aquaticus TaxID=2570229 RepID=A0A4D7QFW6_9HYPH|nr:GIY-YIG nuclease family protein [Phreatobacter aquaticus]QCK85571.1 GIY-YIG nuclease family protein [Phreatobacter aquaticus]